MGTGQGQGQGRLKNNGYYLNNPMTNDRTLDYRPSGDGVGIIYGNISTTQFKFAVSNSGVTRMGYIQVWHEVHGWVLGQITELNLESRLTYSKAQQMSKESKGNYNYGTTNDDLYFEELDPRTNGKLAGFVNVLGFRDLHNVVQLPSSPFAAGQQVYHATNDLINHVLGIDIKKRHGAYIGLLRNHDSRVHLNINELVQKHVSVIAKTGSGKSYIVGILVEELLKRKIPIIILDPHGEYSGLMHPNIDEHDTRLMSKFGIKPHGYSDSIHEYSLNPDVNSGTLPLKLPSYGLSPDAIIELLDLRGSGVQTSIMFKSINKLANKKMLFTLDELIHMVELDRNNAKWHLINNLENLVSTGLFSDHPTRLTELVQPGRATVINLRGIPPMQQQITVTHLTRQLFEARKLNKIPAMMLVVEEAHQFCPQQGRARSSNILKTIASEGRKFGLGMSIVTQRPAMVDKNILSQCGTQIILKVTNPNDLKAIVSSVEGLNNSTIDEIQRLPISVAILVGAGIQLPIFVDVRVRETKHGGRPVDIFSNVDTFYPDQAQHETGGYLNDQNMYESLIKDKVNEQEPCTQDINEDSSATEHFSTLKKSRIFPEELLDRLEQRFNEPSPQKDDSNHQNKSKHDEIDEDIDIEIDDDNDHENDEDE
jgi:DNA helicase HerA-like ATPase